MKRRVEREKRTVGKMISLYCRKNHTSNELCNDCVNLRNYTSQRVANCVLLPAKPAYSECPVPCYKNDMREKIREVMKFSGPRMTINHPWLAIMHLYDKFVNTPLPRNK